MKGAGEKGKGRTSCVETVVCIQAFGGVSFEDNLGVDEVKDDVAGYFSQIWAELRVSLTKSRARKD